MLFFSGNPLASLPVPGANWAQDAGVYVFTMGDDGSKIKARYSFINFFEDAEWKISHHNSSVMPEGLLAKEYGKAPVKEVSPFSFDALLQRF
jgi:hypothetical protein